MTAEPKKEEIFLAKPPKNLKEMTREERRAWAAELHAKIVGAMAYKNPQSEEK